MKQKYLCDVFEQFEELIRCNKEYKDPRASKGTVDKRMIDVNSIESQIIADTYKDGCSYRASTEMSNKCLIENNLLFVACDELMSLVKRLDPDMSAVEKAKQGSKDPGCNWAKARV